jgi:hypothetical protein
MNKWLVSIGCLGIATFNEGCRPMGGRPGLDHFKAWEATAETAERRVHLKGQFDKEPVPTRVGRLAAFANPVVKNGEKIRNPNAHLTWYQVRREEPRRVVRFKNQFGLGKWRIRDARWLLLPAEKKEPGLVFPQELDHFLCYDTQPYRSMRRTVNLEDQFDKARRKTEEVTLEPAYFCVPVEKEGHQLNDPRAHLAVYRIKPSTNLQPPLDPVAVRDQFGDHKLKIGNSLFLAVPTWKLSEGKTWRQPPRSSLDNPPAADATTP